MTDILIAVFFLLILILVWVILYDSNRFVIRDYEISDPRIRKPFQAVVLADLHNKQYGCRNEKLLTKIDTISPDIILIAGDILTARPGESLSTAVDLIQSLAGKYAVYYGNGNHEHRLKLYPETYGSMGECFSESLDKAGVTLLVNRGISLPEYGVCITGSQIDRQFYKRFRVQPMAEDYLNRLLGSVDKSLYTILIAHNPDYFPQYASWGADLVLSGHVHGGIVRIPFLGKGIASPSIRLFPKYDGGEFRIQPDSGSEIPEEKNACSRMIVSRGLGMHTIPIRMFNPGELIVLHFKG